MSDSEREQQQQQQHSSFPNATSPSSTRTTSSTFSYHAPVSPSPLQHQFSKTGSSSADTNSSSGGYDHSNLHSYSHSPYSRNPPPYQQLDRRWRRSASTSASESQPGSPGVDVMDTKELGVLGRNSSGGGGMAIVPRMILGVESWILSNSIIVWRTVRQSWRRSIVSEWGRCRWVGWILVCWSGFFVKMKRTGGISRRGSQMYVCLSLSVKK